MRQTNGEGLVKKIATSAVRPAIGDSVCPDVPWRAGGGFPFGIAIIVLAVILNVSGAARAGNECGQPEAGTPIVCSPSNYDAATDGNIVYRPGEANGDDFTIRLTDDLWVRYDRNDPDDDQLVFPGEGDPLYSAVRIETDADFAGDISFFSSADLTSNARGLSVAHYGTSGAMRTEISGGAFSIASDWERAYAIHSYRGDEFDANDEFTGDHDLIVRHALIDLDGAPVGILGSHSATGDLNVAVQDTDIEIDAELATGVYGALHDTGDLIVDVQNSRIELSGEDKLDGIFSIHLGSGNNSIAVQDTDIEIGAELATGIFGVHRGTGDVTVDVQNAKIDMSGTGQLEGIIGYHVGSGNANVAVRNADIKVDAELATGVIGAHRDAGDLNVDVENVTMELGGAGSTDGIYGFHLGGGNTHVAVRNSVITVNAGESEGTNGISFRYWGGKGGDLTFDIRDVDIDVSGGKLLDGIWGGYWGEEGDIRVDVRRADIVTKGTDSGGMSFIHDRKGDIDIAARDVDIKVEGDRSVGIGGGQRHAGTGDIAIDVRDSTIAVMGESVAGIRAFNFTGEGSIGIRVDGGTITAEGAGSSGILVGLTGRIFGQRTGPIKAPAGETVELDRGEPDGDSGGDSAAGGYRPQDVFVNGRVWGGTGVGAGVRLYGGGRVEIGPRGSVGADSGVAVRAEADGAALHVDAQLDSRPLSDAIAGEIRNDDGWTTVVVNGVVLHDGVTGATGLRAPNGARDISLAASETVAGRAFMPADFHDLLCAARSRLRGAAGVHAAAGRLGDGWRALAPPGLARLGHALGRTGLLFVDSRERRGRVRFRPLRLRGRGGCGPVAVRSADRFGLAAPRAGFGGRVRADGGRKDRGRGRRRVGRAFVERRRRLPSGRPRLGDALRGGPSRGRPGPAGARRAGDGALARRRGGPAFLARRQSVLDAAGVVDPLGRFDGRLPGRGGVAGLTPERCAVHRRFRRRYGVRPFLG